MSNIAAKGVNLNILIFHRIPYHKINYHLSIDHKLHHVTYIGLAKNLANLPSHIQYQAIERPGLGDVADEVIDAIRSRNLAVDLVISMSEFEQFEAAKVRKILGIAGTTIEDIRRARNKLLMKQLVTSHGLRAPRALTLTEFVSVMKVPWQGKTVIKPLNGSASVDVRIFENPAALHNAVSQGSTGIARLDRPGPALDQFEVEEFITGELLHFDGLVKNGKVILVRGSRYVGDCFSYAQGQPLGSVQIETAWADEMWVQKTVDAIGIRQGAFHLEAIMDGPEKVFLEIANRAGGANVVETFRMATGINLLAADLTIQLGEDIRVRIRKKSRKYGWFVFPGHHLPEGTCQISGQANYIDHPMMIRCATLGKKALLPREITYQSKVVPMSGIICGSSSEDMINWLKKMFRDVKIKSVSPQPVRKKKGEYE